MSEHITIPLGRGYFTIISKEDEDLAAYKWHAVLAGSNRAFTRHAGTSSGRPYAHRADTSKVFPGMMHKIIMTRIVGAELPRFQIIDHKDNNPLNNTRENLRLATAAENARNRAKDPHSKSGYKGVRPQKNGKFSAYIGINRKTIRLGTFDTAEEAHAAYCEAAKELFGEFARYE